MPNPAVPARPDGVPLDDAKRSSVRSLAALNFTIADVQNGMGPYVALFLQSAAQWNPAQIGTVLACGNIAQVIAQTPAGAMIDQTRRKRGLLAIGIVLIALACIVTPLFPNVAVVGAAQMSIGIAGAIFPPTLGGGGAGPGRAQTHGPADGHQPGVATPGATCSPRSRSGPSATYYGHEMDVLSRGRIGASSRCWSCVSLIKPG